MNSPRKGPGAANAPQAMQLAVAAYQQRDWTRAEALARTVLQAESRHFGALSLLGIIAAQSNRPADAAELLGRAAAARPSDASAQNNFGIALKNLGRFEEALQCYARALRLEPTFAEGWYNRGVVLEAIGRPEEALQSYERAVRIAPGYADAFNNRGRTLHALRRLEEALASYDQAIRHKPAFAEAHNNRGVALLELGRHHAALVSFDAALSIHPLYPEAHNNRARALRALGRTEDAVRSSESAIKLQPGLADYHNILAAGLHELGRFEEALRSFDRALELNPGFAAALSNRGVVLQDLRRLADARESCERSLSLRENDPQTHYNLGNILRDLAQTDAALRAYDRALELRPGFVAAHRNRAGLLVEAGRLRDALEDYERALQVEPEGQGLHGLWLHTRMHAAEWQGFDPLLADLIAKIARGTPASPPFPALTLLDSPSLQRQATQAWVRATLARPAGLPTLPRYPRRQRIRVAYYSADFHGHATAYLMAGLVEAHDREEFEVTGVSFGPDIRDGMRERLESAFDRFLDVGTRSDREIASLSRALEIDIAVDLKGFTKDARPGIFGERAAPVQVSYLGYPATMAVPFIDYLVADHTLIPPGSRHHYAEKIAYVADSYQVNDRLRAIADGPVSREEHGLPATGLVFCSFNNSYKITPTVFRVWMRILGAVPASVLWLLATDDAAMTALRAAAIAEGIAASRLVFAPRLPLGAHLARHRAGDLFLDTWPCTAHTTASDALWAGLPVLTLMGESFAARVAASLLNAIGLPDLVTTSAEDYETLAVRLARDPAALKALKDRVAANRLTTSLFDTTQSARKLEGLYRRMYERYHAGLGPDHIGVEPQA